MKTLIFYLVLMLCAGFTNAQEITELKEARVGFAPLTAEVTRSGDDFSYKVTETYAGEFEKDPLLFMENHFDIKNFIAEVKGKDYHTYVVTFRSSKGNLQTNFNRNGELVRSNSKFKNTVLPRNLRHQLYNDHKGWEMIGNIHITNGKNGVVDQNIFKVRLKNGKARKNVIFDTSMSGIAIVGN